MQYQHPFLGSADTKFRPFMMNYLIKPKFLQRFPWDLGVSKICSKIIKKLLTGDTVFAILVPHTVT